MRTEEPERSDSTHLTVSCISLSSAMMLALVLGGKAPASEKVAVPADKVASVHRDAMIVDFHCDAISRFIDGEDLRKELPEGHIDIPKLKRGGVDLQVFACFVGPPENEEEKKTAAGRIETQIDAVYRLVGQNPHDLALVRSFDEYAAAQKTGRIGMLIGIEGGYGIENDLAKLNHFYDRGVRIMTLTHWNRTDWADASGDEKAEFCGLTELGERIVREMNRLGMIIDISHVHDETFWDVLRITDSPVVASHSCCRALSNHHRNLSDEMLKALATNGGVIGINFAPGFLNAELSKKQEELLAEVAKKHGLPPSWREIEKAEPQKREEFEKELKARFEEARKGFPPVDVKLLVDHIDHAVKVMGDADHVGLGSDYDGIGSTPVGLENAGKLEAITSELAARGYTEDDIKKILGGNFLRVIRAVCDKQLAAR
ncbi:MAG: dipeptidase [Acidobacteriota bacterium]